MRAATARSEFEFANYSRPVIPLTLSLEGSAARDLLSLRRAQAWKSPRTRSHSIAFDRLMHERCKRFDKPRGIAHGGHHFELFDAGGMRFLACFDIDLV
jgi:hypothetical protein